MVDANQQRRPGSGATRLPDKSPDRHFLGDKTGDSGCFWTGCVLLSGSNMAVYLGRAVVIVLAVGVWSEGLCVFVCLYVFVYVFVCMCLFLWQVKITYIHNKKSISQNEDAEGTP